MTDVRPLTRVDLKGFDEQARDLVLDAVDQGAMGRVTRRGHAVLYSPDGRRTATVPPKLDAQSRTLHNVRANIRALRAPTRTYLDGEFKCEQCVSTFDSEASLRMHVVNAHGDRVYRCTLCDLEYRTPGALGLHNAAKHSTGPTTCEVCGREFLSPAGLGAHRRVHAPRPPKPPKTEDLTPEERLERIAVLVLDTDLQAEVAYWRKRAEDAEARVNLIKEAMGA